MSSVVLLSSGLDSSFNLYRAHADGGVALALTFDYGQKAALAERRQSAELCRQLGIPHKIIELPWFRDFTSTSLVGAQKVPSGGEISMDDMNVSNETKKAVWVPNRNGIFLNIGAGFAEGINAEFIIPGFNKEEAATFPDNSQGYLQSLNHAFSFSTEGRVTVKCYSTEMAKTEILTESIKLGIPLEKLWPCYHAGAKWCGECESCQRFARALSAAGANERGNFQ
jgi:7-cyano-7-deazaguanine synthase